MLSPTPGWFDSDAVYSPTIFAPGGESDDLVMIYAGHCYVDCTRGWGVTLLAATSKDGATWTKRDKPVLTKNDAPAWADEGVGEPGLLLGADGAYYLFFTSVHADERAVGIARGASPFGPWEVAPDPILEASVDGFDRGGVLAPVVRQDGDLVRMWFLGILPGETGFAVGYAEADWPLWHV